MNEHRHLATSRLVLKPVTAADAAALHELWTAPGVRRFLWDDQVIPFSRTHGIVERSRQLFDERGFGLWGAFPRTSQATLEAFGGLWPFRDQPEFELLYGVAEHAWGRGYATEIAQAVTTFCFGSLGMLSVRASTDVANAASIRVLAKLGFALSERGMVDGLDTVFYELPRPAAF